MELDQDTLQMAHDIEDAGLEREPAEAISRAIHRHGRQLATRADVDRLGESTGKRFDQLEKATKADVEQLRRETAERFDRVGEDIAQLRQESTERFDRMTRTIIGFGSALVLTLMGGFVTLALTIVTNAGSGG